MDFSRSLSNMSLRRSPSSVSDFASPRLGCSSPFSPPTRNDRGSYTGRNRSSASSISSATSFASLSDTSLKTIEASMRSSLRIFELREETRLKLLHAISNIKSDILAGLAECFSRHIMCSVQWLTELGKSFATTDPTVKSHIAAPDNASMKPAFSFDHRDPEAHKTFWAKCLMETNEFQRAAFVTRNCTGPVATYLHLYCRYHALGKSIRDRQTVLPDDAETDKSKWEELLSAVQKAEKNKSDGYFSYLRGLLYRKLKRADKARAAFARSVKKSPLNWDAWNQLAEVVTSKEMERHLKLPDHWMKYFFNVRSYHLLERNDDCVALVECLLTCGFHDSNFLCCEITGALHNMRQPIEAVGYMMQVRQRDPFCMDYMDLFSNVLYVQEMKVELAHLAKDLFRTDKLRCETQCVMGNMNSLKGDHAAAVKHFQRVLRLNPDHPFVWTVLGHEFIQMTDANSAIQCYNKAVEMNPRDFRAWYGLGQAYEVLSMYNHSLYYYKRAAWMRPYDVRLYVAMGVAYENLHHDGNARVCYERACRMDDPENMALFRLAKSYADMGLDDSAAEAFAAYLEKAGETGISTVETLTRAHKFLALYCIRKNRLKQAEKHALGLQDYVHSRDDAKRCLELISKKMASLGLGDDRKLRYEANEQRRTNPSELGVSALLHGSGSKQPTQATPTSVETSRCQRI